MLSSKLQSPNGEDVSGGMNLAPYIVSLLALLSEGGTGKITSIGNYGDDFADLEFPDERENCLDGTCLLYTKKRTIIPETVAEHRLMSKTINTAKGPWGPVCDCAAQHKLISLGEGHYPRYITTSRCKTRTCANKFYQCKYYEYRVHVLAKRGLSSILENAEELGVQDVDELALPESLHANWQLFSLSVPVACVAVEKS